LLQDNGICPSLQCNCTRKGKEDSEQQEELEDTARGKKAGKGTWERDIKGRQTDTWMDGRKGMENKKQGNKDRRNFNSAI
jgi:hypothetical protein